MKNVSDQDFTFVYVKLLFIKLFSTVLFKMNLQRVKLYKINSLFGFNHISSLRGLNRQI